MPGKRKGGLLKRMAELTDLSDDECDTRSVQQRSSSSIDAPCGRTGIRQRLEADAGNQQLPKTETPLVDIIKKGWGSGKLSAKLSSEILHGATAQGATGCWAKEP